MCLTVDSTACYIKSARKREKKEMTKKEMAIRVASDMKKIRNEIDVEKLAAKLMKGMTIRELQLVIDRHERMGK